MIYNKYLYSRDSKGKIRVLVITIERSSAFGATDENAYYRIFRKSGLL